jgi:NAD(P)H-hydrate epimerase
MAAETPTVTRSQMAEVDRLMVDVYGIALEQMMELAGTRLAELAHRLLGDLRGKRTAVLAGRGNNGGGALVAARHASNRGADVSVVLSRDAADYGGVPGDRLRTLQTMGIDVRTRGDLPAADVIFDGIIGYSLVGAPRGQELELIERANSSDAPTLSLDVPSGLDPDTAAAPGAAVRAEWTMTLALPKPGLLAEHARGHVGRLFLADIGVPPALLDQMGIRAERIFAESPIVAL